MKIYRILNSKSSYVAVDEESSLKMFTIMVKMFNIIFGNTVVMTTTLKRLQRKMPRCRQLLIREKAIMKLRKCVVAKR